eukprot:365996-Chlamydomonas_euryale.AAC.9
MALGPDCVPGAYLQMHGAYQIFTEHARNRKELPGNRKEHTKTTRSILATAWSVLKLHAASWQQH